MTQIKQCKLKGAYWIKPPREAYEQKGLAPDLKESRFVYYRYAVHLDEPDQLEISISANSRYRLWINGEPIVSGPCKGDRWRHYYETLNVGSSLRSGLNIFAVQVWSLNTYLVNDPLRADQPLYSISSLPVGPRLALNGICRNAHGESLADLTTGVADWRVYVDDAITFHSDEKYTIFLGAIAERVNAGRLPHGWKYEEKPEGGWFKAEKSEPCLGIEDPYPFYIVPTHPLVERPIPLLYERKRDFIREMPIRKDDVKPFSFINSVVANEWVEIPSHSHVVVELDAGELVTGYPAYCIEQGEGACVTFRYAERYFKPGNEKSSTVRDDARNGVIIGFEDVYYPSGRTELYEPFWLRTFRFVRIEVQTEERPLRFLRPWYRESAYPLQPRSSVVSPVSWVESLYNISLRTLQFCMHETYEDCPYYEQMQFIMDTRLQALFTYSAGGDIGLIRKALEDFHCSLLPEGITQNRFPSTMVQIIPSFSLHYIFMLHDYYWQTGDINLIKRYRPTIDAILDWFDRKVGESGLVERIGYWEYIDWVTEWEGGEPSACKVGPSTIHNLVYASALQVAAKLYFATGRSQIGDEYEVRAQSILCSIERLCWSEERGMYREGPAVEQYSQHAQLWAVLTGLCEGERAKSILNRALDKPQVLKCSFSMAFYLFRALEKGGLYERTAELMKQWRDLLPLQLTTLPETPVEARSDCHAWSALPIYEFTHCILGVKSVKPGWSEILIEPQTLDIPEMKGEIYTPAGVISVGWCKSDTSFFISGKVPDGVPFRVRWSGGIDSYYKNGGSFHESVKWNE
ncbi:alpha-L-rhamnosidase C-terminal domain-containing protein [Paenibacillus terreus]|uniref:Alpha-L-rhamnosidase C-terminal domain-containing protein n=1 Tax=Paenibacillus terreus TaxID=1387834 RepID=A0ABV5BF73_9BACL